MVNRVAATCEKFSLIENGDKIIVALSGGADSVTLLHVLYSLKEKYNLTLYAAHLNHQIRGAEAERDERFCKILCEKYNIELFTETRDIPSLAEARKISCELCGRQERYAFFDRLSVRLGAKTATAHTSSDNAETLVYNLARGASVFGAAAIPVRRGGIIRPLIGQTRAQIESYCAQNGLEYVTDSTNLSDDYTRNKIRHQLIPAFKTLNPSFEAAAQRFSQSAADAADFIKISAEKALEESKTNGGYDVNILLKNHNAVLYAALSMVCMGKAERVHLEQLASMLSGGGAVSLPGGGTAVCRQGVLRFYEQKNRRFTEIALESDISFNFGDTKVCAHINKKFAEGQNPVFRTRKSGDSFTYPDRGVTKPLRKMMNELKIPSEQRDFTLLLCLNSTVLWCMGAGFSRQGRQLCETADLTIKTYGGAGGYYAQEH